MLDVAHCLLLVVLLLYHTSLSDSYVSHNISTVAHFHVSSHVFHRGDVVSSASIIVSQLICGLFHSYLSQSVIGFCQLSFGVEQCLCLNTIELECTA